MKNDEMPEGYLATREGDTVRVHLPEVVVTSSHVLEPMLTRGAAQQVAEALWNADVEAPIARVVLVRDPRYAEATVEKFRERLWAMLVEGGVEAQIETGRVRGARETDPPAPAAPAPPPVAPAPAAGAPGPAAPAAGAPAPPTASPAPAAPKSTAPEPSVDAPRKTFVAPVP